MWTCIWCVNYVSICLLHNFWEIVCDPWVMCLQCQGGVKYDCFCIHWFYLIHAHYLSSSLVGFTMFYFWNGQGLALKMTSSPWQSFIGFFGRSFSSHVQHQRKNVALKGLLHRRAGPIYYVATPFRNTQGLALKMTSSSWQLVIRSFGRSFRQTY